MSSTAKSLGKRKRVDKVVEVGSDDEDKKVTSRKKKPKEGTSNSNNNVQLSYDEDVKKTKKRPKVQNDSSSTNKPQPKKQKVQDDKKNIKPTWEPYQILSDEQDIPEFIAENIIRLLEEDNTIPFIARYRKNEIGNLSPEELRSCKDIFEKTLILKNKMATVIKSMEKKTELNDEIRTSILSVRSIDVLEEIYAPYKEEKLNSLLERAKAVNLEPPALNIINGKLESLQKYVGTFETLKSIEDVKKGIQHIIAHRIATDPETLQFLRDVRREIYFILETKEARKRKNDDEKKGGVSKKPIDESKYKLYFDFRSEIKNIKPHQILAINRAERLKVISVKIQMPEIFERRFKTFCSKKWMGRNIVSKKEYAEIMNASIDDCFKRIVSSMIKKEIRSELKSKAENESLSVFTGNLKQILLAMPSKGVKVLGVDPGLTHGCKLGLISETGSVIETTVVYLNKNNSLKNNFEQKIATMLINNNCSLIALGNGTACRQMEAWISDMIGRNLFYPLDVKYTIVNESGASVYSCSPEAKKEFPSMDPNLISAVSLARRVQEPLAELVKIEPKHLGVGMYQHDLPPKRLDEALDEVISECVSFVGVDLNTTSQCLLRRVAGLTDKKATDIIKYRETNGPFTTREELKKVKGIGEHTFKQCAGFLRVNPTAHTKTNNKLDLTIIHPESYKIAQNVLKHLNLNERDVGCDSFIDKIKKSETSILKDFKNFETNLENLKLILDGLSKPINYDFREHGDNQPLFKKGVTDINDVTVGTVLSGCVSNVVPFGCFVDVGVGINGLIHSSKLKGTTLQIGDRVEVEVLNIDIYSKRIGLGLKKSYK